MAYSKKLLIKEDLKDLKKLRSKHSSYLQIRISMLILIKNDTIHSKRGLAKALGVSPTSIQDWKDAYISGGLEKLLFVSKINKKPTLFTPAINDSILKRLSSPTDAFVSYKELLTWVQENFLPSVNYFMLYQHVTRKFKTKLKVARKSHIKKDSDAVDVFKKK